MGHCGYNDLLAILSSIYSAFFAVYSFSVPVAMLRPTLAQATTKQDLLQSNALIA